MKIAFPRAIQFAFLGPLLLLTVARLHARDVTFSKDGKQIYAVESGSHLFDIDVEKQSAAEINIGPLIDNELIVAVSTSNFGDLLVATAKHAWSCNIEKKVCTKTCDAPKGVSFEDMASDPMGRGILFRVGDDSDRKATFFLERGTSQPLPLSIRPGGRLQGLDGMAFSPTGELFFVTRGAFWYGTIALDAESRSWFLTANRIAPLARANDAANVEVELAGIAAARTYLYALLNRHKHDSGHITETIVRMQKPKTGSDAPSGKMANRDSPHVAVNEVASVSVPVDLVGWALCASPDGKRIIYGHLTTGDNPVYTGSLEAAGKAYLIENDGKPRELKVKLPEEASPTATPLPVATPIETPTPFATATPTGQKPSFYEVPDYMQRQLKELFPSATPRVPPTP